MMRAFILIVQINYFLVLFPVLLYNQINKTKTKQKRKTLIFTTGNLTKFKVTKFLLFNCIKYVV